jgi:trehalose 6-phosphate phosphatase
LTTDHAGAALEPIRGMLARGDRICLFLDFDGTLLEIAETPDAIHVDPALPALLARTRDALDGALALVSGRTLAELDALLAPLKLPAAGVHGYERRDSRGALHHRPPRREALEPVRHRFVEFVGRDPGLLLEDKGEALALHYRRAPQLGGAVLEFASQVVEALPAGFALQPGDMVVEVKSRLFSKGSAVQDFLREPPFARRQPVAIGDDFTDVDAFRVVEYLGGLSIAVGHRIGGRERLPGPAQVRRFLAGLVEVVETTDRAHA